MSEEMLTADEIRVRVQQEIDAAWQRMHQALADIESIGRALVGSGLFSPVKASISEASPEKVHLYLFGKLPDDVGEPLPDD